MDACDVHQHLVEYPGSVAQASSNQPVAATGTPPIHPVLNVRVGSLPGSHSGVPSHGLRAQHPNCHETEIRSQSLLVPR